MRRRKRGDVSEINLTPLLDVLFSILFIVMMAGMQNEKGIKEDYQQQVEQLEQKNDELEEQIIISQNQMSSYDKYQTEAVIITVTNIVENGNHNLIVKQGLEEEEIENIQLGTDRTENTKSRINKVISELVEIADNQPVYIVFYCDKEHIYTTEYRAITEAFNGLQEAHKEVFFKVMEDDK